MNRRDAIEAIRKDFEDQWAVAFGRVGYEFKIRVDEDEFPLITLTTYNVEFPDIKVGTVRYGDSGSTCFQFECNLTFPEINYNSEYEYEDHTEYVIANLWVPLAKVITDFQKWSLCWDDYIEE